MSEKKGFQSSLKVLKPEKPFYVQFIRKPLRVKEYKGRNGKVYRDTVYEMLGIKIVNPKIYVDEKSGDEFVIWYPNHEQIFNLIKMTMTLHDNYSKNFFMKLTKFLLLHLFAFENVKPDELKEFIDRVFNEIMFVQLEKAKEENGERNDN